MTSLILRDFASEPRPSGSGLAGGNRVWEQKLAGLACAEACSGFRFRSRISPDDDLPQIQGVAHTKTTIDGPSSGPRRFPLFLTEIGVIDIIVEARRRPNPFGCRRIQYPHPSRLRLNRRR